MRIKDILNEGVTDIVARLYKEAGADFDKFYNPEDAEYKEKNQEYYDDHFKEWFKNEITPVFMKPTVQKTAKYTSKPKQGASQSPGFRGQQYARARADMSYDHNVQKYDSTMPVADSGDLDAIKGNTSNNG